MKLNEEKLKKFIKKINQSKKGKMDLSIKEDLAIGIMNLISLEEHFHFTAQKTKNTNYYNLLKKIRQIRTNLLKRIIKEYEGEIWCISKHLLASSMRVMEAGTKYQSAGKEEDAEKMFNTSYDLFSLFWALNLKLINPGKIKKIKDDQIDKDDDDEKSLMGKMKDLIKRAIDCCIE